MSTATLRTALGPTLSARHAATFSQCPMLYRFRTLDRLPEPATPDTARSSHGRRRLIPGDASGTGHDPARGGG